MIYESPDGGSTVYARNSITEKRVLIKQSNTGITYTDFIDIIDTAKQVPALQKALDNVIILYKLTKDYD